jgi:hypothetical protein
MTTAPRPVKPQQWASRGHIHTCVHPDHIACLSQRHGIDKPLATLLNGCDCPCHHNANGVPVPYGAWVPPGQREPIGVLHAIRLEKIEDKEGDDTWLL